MSYSVEDMCKAGHTSRRGVRYWEEQGLLGDVSRTDGNQRQYSENQIRLAKIIAAAQFSGMTLAEIKTVIEDYDVIAMNEILTRLHNQMRLAKALGDALPLAPDVQEFDL